MSEKRSLFSQIYSKGEAFIMQRIPRDKPGFFIKWMFRGPKYLYKLGLGGLVSDSILLLTTTGRKSGLKRETPIGYYYDEPNNRYYLMAGWQGRTDWYRNAIANPQVLIQVGKKKINCRAEKTSDENVAQQMLRAVEKEPGALDMWKHIADLDLEPTYDGLLKAAPSFPSLWLVPE